MRLSEWQQAAPTADAMTNRVRSVLESVLADLGAAPDPECWVVWGEDPDRKYSILAPTSAGLINIAMRAMNPAEGPRATAKLIRWSKVAVGELSLEATDGYRMVAVQVEGLVIKGMDKDADLICAFVRGLIAGTDGRGQQMIPMPFMGALPGAPAASVGAPAAPSATPSAPSATPAASVGAPAKKASTTRLPALPSGKGSATPEPAADAAADAVAPSKSTTPKPAKGTPPKMPVVVPIHAAPASIPPAPVPAVPAPIAPVAAVTADIQTAVPRPLAARAAKASAAPELKPADLEAPLAPAEEEVDPDRSRWVGPHSIGDEQARRQEKPRWMP
jgi:hypothetical protein